MSFRARIDWAWICRRVAAWGVPRRDADDVAQEIVIAMSRARLHLVVPGGWRQEEARRAVLRGILRRHVADYLTARRRRPAMEPGGLSAQIEETLATAHGPDAQTAPSAEDLALGNACQALLAEALAVLERTAPEQHAVMVAHELDEMPMHDVAAKLGIREGTAWNRLRLGRAALWATLRRWGVRRIAS